MVLTILLVIWIPCPPVGSDSCNENLLNKSSLNASTNIIITEVDLEYRILTTGEYTCSFNAESLGNNLTESGDGHCQITIQNPPIEQLKVEISGEEVNFTTSIENNSYIIFFPLNPILSNSRFEIEGNFIGNFKDNRSGVYIYELGIDWGTTVAGIQSTLIRFDDYYKPIYYDAMFTDFVAGESQFSWNEYSVTGFTTRLELQPRSVSSLILQISISSWNAIAGESKLITIQNIAEFNITAFIILPPNNWFMCNVSKFTLQPNQQIMVQITPDRSIPVGSNATIEIVSTQFVQSIIIPVTIISTTPVNDSHFLILALSIVSLTCILGVMVYKRDEIVPFYQKYRQNLFKNTSNPELLNDDNSLPNDNTSKIIAEEHERTWQSIQSKWETILPEKELEVISILFYQGSKNQKTIAQEIGVSKMTISRIISRLETKRLIVRERLGMSNMVKLKKDHL